MDVEFHGVLPCVGAWTTHHEGDALVQHDSLGILELPKGNGTVVDFIQSLRKHLGTKGKSVLAGHPDDSDATGTRRGGDGANGGAIDCISKRGVHGANLA